jgi:hypothetical protein
MLGTPLVITVEQKPVKQVSTKSSYRVRAPSVRIVIYAEDMKVQSLL